MDDNTTDCGTRVEVNGETRVVAIGTTIRALLVQLQIPDERIAVELNRELLPRARFEQSLGTGDRIEIVTFVGGG